MVSYAQARTALAMTTSWLFWALLAAAFAALTAIFGKLGVEHVNADFATLLRTLVVVVGPGGHRPGHRAGATLASIAGRSYLFLLLSGVATGLSWLCYYRRSSWARLAGGAGGQVERGAGGDLWRGAAG